MSLRLPVLIFDLDGTLTDSKPGILGCLREVLDARNMTTTARLTALSALRSRSG